MADNKDYISQEQDNGTVHISEDVLASIAAAAIHEIDGVYSLNDNTSNDIEKRSRKSLGKDVKLTIAGDEITVDCNVIIYYGYSVIEVAKNIQDAVSVALVSMAGLNVSSVNVNVSGIAMEKKSK